MKWCGRAPAYRCIYLNEGEAEPCELHAQEGRRATPGPCPSCGDIKRPMCHALSDHRESASDAWLRRARLRAIAYGVAFGLTVAGGGLLALRGVEAFL